eukprot:CAMPEP_0173415650 /NCGR_PEP_ID=MMETSP1356-20130122/84977_1 /TAXON_ID=77927 ORGANISM="Hemiselmis virescens, Strain PCC157" /NCGR_SAMPLE_ID=MMETSP1356 /ASSEMBLY_ACC=CAM_ASM_000847 /LENGTH=463 /DNA_ID=CAMNT_0014377915 /DNA_START=40 /DNA_END=1431 /DNA_ORIENTATION=-
MSEWRLCQTLGELPSSELVDGTISAVEFDHSGRYLATGDRAGRVRIYSKENSDSHTPVTTANKPMSAMRSALWGNKSPNKAAEKAAGGEYGLWHEFQSHEAEFDYLKSVEIEEKINCLRWLKPINNSLMLLTTNDKTVKLWRVRERERPVALVEQYTSAPRGGSRQALRLPLYSKERRIMACPRKTFANGHAYHINSVSLVSDSETFLSADDLRINLWNFDISGTSFNIVDIKPDNMEELTEVITASACHPSHCHHFLWSNSRGSIKLADMRQKALCDDHAKVYEEEDDPSRRSFFSEIISSIADIKFSSDGRYILSRDYMCLKLWDVNMERQPLRTIYVHEQLRSSFCDLYENDSIFDKFQCSFSGDNQRLITGSYHNYFHVYDRNGKTDTCVEATKVPKKKSGVLPKPKFRSGKKDEVLEMDLDKKIMHCSWHPTQPAVAVGALNTVFVYAADGGSSSASS